MLKQIWSYLTNPYHGLTEKQIEAINYLEKDLAKYFSDRDDAYRMAQAKGIHVDQLDAEMANHYMMRDYEMRYEYIINNPLEVE